MPVCRIKWRGLGVVMESDAPVRAAGPDSGCSELEGVLEGGYSASGPAGGGRRAWAEGEGDGAAVGSAVWNMSSDLPRRWGDSVVSEAATGEAGSLAARGGRARASWGPVVYWRSPQDTGLKRRVG